MRTCIFCAASLMGLMGLVAEVAAVTVPATQTVKYDAAYSVCKAVVPVSHEDFSLANTLHPHALATGYFYEHGLTLDPNEPSIITLVEGPTHGKLVPDVDFPKHVFIYHPAEGYLGPDQMTFVIEVMGKKFKVIETVWVANAAPEYGGCPADYKLPPANGGNDKGSALDIIELPADGPIDAEAVVAME